MANRAMELMREGRFGQAQQLLAHSYDLVPAPTIAVLEGDALVKIGRLTEARHRFDAARRTPLSKTTPFPYRQAVALASVRLREVERRTPRLTLVVENAGVDADELRIELNGEPQSAALLGVPRRKDPGEYELLVQAPARRPKRTAFLLSEGVERRVVVDLDADGSSQTADASASPVSGLGVREVGWISVGVGTAGFLTGIVAGAVMADKEPALARECDATCPPSVRDELDDYEGARAVAVAGFGVGLVGTAVGVTLLLSERSEGTALKSLTPYASTRTLGVRGRF
jgi:hypothetical protein